MKPRYPYTKRNKFTRMCIGEAITLLMKDKDFDHISISDITKRSGVSRMTFYNYYNSKDEAVRDYLKEIIDEYIEVEEDDETAGHYREKEHIVKALNFFDKHANFFVTFAKRKKIDFIIEAINSFMIKYVYPNRNYSKYELYYYSGALLNLFLKWEEEGKEISAEEVAEIICK